MNKTKILILITVFIDVAGMGIVIPILPFYVEHFSSAPLLITSLFAVYAVFSFLSAPLIGALSDKIGRKVMLITSIFSTAAGWFVFAAAPNVLFLYLGRIIDGSAAGNFPIAQAYLTDIAQDDRERTTNLGLIGAAFGIAFIMGPFIGGTLGAISHTLPFWIVGCLALINGLLAIFFLPETHHNRQTDKRLSINPFIPLKRAAQNITLRPNYLVWSLFGLAVAGFQSIFALYTSALYNFTEFTVGLLYTAMGVVIALNQAVALKHFWLKKFSEPKLELIMLVIYIIGFTLLAIPNFFVFILGLLATTFGQSVLRVVLNSQIIAKADPKIKGEVLGITSSVTSLSMAVGPLLAGLLFGWSHVLPFLIGAFLLTIAFVILYRDRRALNQKALSGDEVVVSEI